MKKLKILFLFALMPLLVSCTKVISNPDVQTLNQKAVELMNSGDINGAIARMESINDLNPNFPQNHYNLGVAYYKNMEYEKAIESLNKAISLDKNLSDAYYTIGLAYQDLANIEIEKLENPEKRKSDENSKKVELPNEIVNKIKENLSNSKEYYTQYLNLTGNSEEKQRIQQEIENINTDLQKYEKMKLD